MWRYSSCRYCRRLLHECKFPLRILLPRYQHSAAGCSYSFPSSSTNLSLQTCQQKSVKWCKCATTGEEQNESFEILDCSAAASIVDSGTSEANENIFGTLKSFFQTFGSYNIDDILDDLSAQTYEMLLACSPADVPVPFPSSNSICDTVLSMKIRQSLRRPQWTRNMRASSPLIRAAAGKIVRSRRTLPCRSENDDMELVNRNNIQGVHPVSSKFLSAAKENFQLRTLKTTSCSTTIHDMASAAALSPQGKIQEDSKEDANKPVITGDKVPVPDRKTKTASVERLKQLTLQKDVVGLQQLLTEQHWPSYRRIKAFIPELFEVFVVDGKDVQQAIWLMDNFASANSRAVLPNSIILQLLTRIVREKGVKTATNYAQHCRNLFLVKPPLDGYFSPHAAMVAEDLFTEAFKKDNASRIQHLCDALIDLGFLRNSSVYLYAVVKSHLQRDGFDTSLNLWYKNAQKYRVGDGSDLLIRQTILEKNLNDAVREKRLRNILEKLEEFGVFYDGLAELVMELIKAGMIPEAELIMRRLKISGRHFKGALFRLKNHESNLPHVECFATIFSATLLEENRIRITRGRLERRTFPEEGLAKNSHEINAKTYIKSLLAVWQPCCKRKQKVETKRKFKADAGQLQGLIYATQNVWFDLATKTTDLESLERLLSWSAKYNSDGFAKLRKRIEDFLAEKNVQLSSNDISDECL